MEIVLAIVFGTLVGAGATAAYQQNSMNAQKKNHAQVVRKISDFEDERIDQIIESNKMRHESV